MAISVCSFLGHPSPPALPPSAPPLPSKLTPLAKTTSCSVPSPRSEVGWRSQCMTAAAAACVIIGSTVGLGVGDGEVAIASDMRTVEGAPEARKVMRWSDKRRCPPWRANSLENIVPENLPRPSGGGRSNRLAAYSDHMAAPPVRSSIQYRKAGSCFSM